MSQLQNNANLGAGLFGHFGGGPLSCHCVFNQGDWVPACDSTLSLLIVFCVRFDLFQADLACFQDTMTRMSLLAPRTCLGHDAEFVKHARKKTSLRAHRLH